MMKNEVDLAMFSTLNEQDLTSIGISAFGARKIMLNAIKGEDSLPVNCTQCLFYNILHSFRAENPIRMSNKRPAAAISAQ